MRQRLVEAGTCVHCLTPAMAATSPPAPSLLSVTAGPGADPGIQPTGDFLKRLAQHEIKSFISDALTCEIKLK